MSLEDVRDAARIEGKQESVLTLLERIGEVPNNIKERIFLEHREDVLLEMLKDAATVTSFGEFEKLVSKV